MGWWNAKNQEPVELGDEVEDTITGFRGIAVGITEWLHGCRRIIVQPQTLQDGKVGEAYTFDEPQLIRIHAGVVESTTGTGGPIPAAVQKATPPRR